MASTSRIRPSQNVGTDHSVSETPEDTRSNRLPFFQPLRTPSHSPRTTEMIVEVPVSRSVGQSRSAISEVTCWLNW